MVKDLEKLTIKQMNALRKNIDKEIRKRNDPELNSEMKKLVARAKKINNTDYCATLHVPVKLECDACIETDDGEAYVYFTNPDYSMFEGYSIDDMEGIINKTDMRKIIKALEKAEDALSEFNQIDNQFYDEFNKGVNEFF